MDVDIWPSRTVPEAGSPAPKSDGKGRLDAQFSENFASHEAESGSDGSGTDHESGSDGLPFSDQEY